MSPKPHRMLLDRVTGYADEASAFLRRRRLTRQPVRARPQRRRARRRLRAETEEGRALFLAASRVIDAAR